jgi:hypothetical protein
MHEHEVSGRPVRGRQVTVRAVPRRRGSGPRPVRPESAAVAVRPAEVERPAVVRARRRVAQWVSGPRLLVRRPPEAVGRALRLPWAGVQRSMHRVPRLPGLSAPARASSLRRAAAGVAVVLSAAAVVAGLGLVGGAVAEVRAAEVGAGVEGPAVVAAPRAVERTVTVGGERSVWEVARTADPGASGPELAALAERIVVDNSLTSVRLRPGQVLRVTVG